MRFICQRAPPCSMLRVRTGGLPNPFISLVGPRVPRTSRKTLMSPQDDGRSAPRAGARSLLRWVCTNNPFYVISAGLFLAGLRISFGEQAEAIETWALMSGLAGYTLL